MEGAVLGGSVMISTVRSGRRERAGLDTAEDRRDESESSAAYGGQHRGAKWINDRPRQIGGR
jgi:hypothetical protein